MGKKSLDGLSGAEERAQASDRVRLPEEDKRPSRLYGSLLIGREAQRQPPLRLALFRSRQQEQQERDMFIQQVSTEWFSCLSYTCLTVFSLYRYV